MRGIGTYGNDYLLVETGETRASGKRLMFVSFMRFNKR